jgi:hypothetical protein
LGRAQTRASNLQPLCKTHHDWKTAGIIEVLGGQTVHGPTSRTSWLLTATGHVAWHDPSPLHPAAAAQRLGVATRPRATVIEDPPNGCPPPDHDDDPPPPF